MAQIVGLGGLEGGLEGALAFVVIVEITHAANDLPKGIESAGASSARPVPARFYLV